MTVGDLKKVLTSLPDSFAVRIASDGPTTNIRSISIESGSLVLREHMLTIGRVVDTFTAFDGSEYVLTVSSVKYPTVVQMPHPIQSQLRASLKRLESNRPQDIA